MSSAQCFACTADGTSLTYPQLLRGSSPSQSCLVEAREQNVLNCAVSSQGRFVPGLMLLQNLESSRDEFAD